MALRKTVEYKTKVLTAGTLRAMIGRTFVFYLSAKSNPRIGDFVEFECSGQRVPDVYGEITSVTSHGGSSLVGARGVLMKKDITPVDVSEWEAMLNFE